MLLLLKKAVGMSPQKTNWCRKRQKGNPMDDQPQEENFPTPFDWVVIGLLIFVFVSLDLFHFFGTVWLVVAGWIIVGIVIFDILIFVPFFFIIWYNDHHHSRKSRG
jgi:hypothetical protein